MSDLAIELARGAAERWCVRRNCTTCGCREMRALLNEGYPPDRQRASLDDLKVLAASLAALDPEDDVRLASLDQGWLEEAVMWLIYGIWRNAGDVAHETIFPIMQDTWAGSIYKGMQAHYEGVRTTNLSNLRQTDSSQMDLFE